MTTEVETQNTIQLPVKSVHDDSPQDWYFTFGASNHPFGYCYLVVKKATLVEARNVVQSAFGNKWSMQYTAESFKGQVDDYSLHELAVLTKTKFGTWRPITIGGQPAL